MLEPTFKLNIHTPRGDVIKKLRDVLQEREGAIFLQVLNNFEYFGSIWNSIEQFFRSIFVYFGQS